MFSKLKSRKLWATVLASTLVVLGSQLGIPEAVTLKITAIVSAYIVGQGIADAGAK